MDRLVYAWWKSLYNENSPASFRTAVDEEKLLLLHGLNTALTGIPWS